MAVYKGTTKVKAMLNDKAMLINLFSKIPILNGIMLKSSDDAILKDSKGVYITVKERE